LDHLVRDAGPQRHPCHRTRRRATGGERGAPYRSRRQVTVSATTGYFICVNKTTPAATTVNLPPSPATGLTFVIKDCAGVAATYNNTLTPAAGNIDGASTYVQNINHQSTTVSYDGTQWELN